MKEHTINVVRQMLSDQDRGMLTDLKEKQRHASRSLQEALPSFFRASPSRQQQMARAAAQKAGITDQNAIRQLTAILQNDPGAILKGSFWGQAGGAVASALVHGKADTNYRVSDVGGTLSREASSLERVGGSAATGAYKVGRALQKAEKWLTPWDPEQGDPTMGIGPRNNYGRGSAFDPSQNRGARDQCIVKKVNTPGGPMYIGHKMGSPGYEKCMSGDGDDASNVRELQRVLKRPGVSSKVSDFVANLGMDPDMVLQRTTSDVTHRGRVFGRAVQAFRGGRQRGPY